MKINCRHGHFVFEESRAGEIAEFSGLFGIDMILKDNFFTFDGLEDIPSYSIKGAPFLDAVAIKTFEGKPWEVLDQNDLVWNFNLGKLVPIATIAETVEYTQVGNYFISPGLILPGSLTAEGLRVTDYAAWFTTDTMKFKYSEVTSV